MRDDVRWVLALASVEPLAPVTAGGVLAGRAVDGRPCRVPGRMRRACESCVEEGWLARRPVARPGRGLVYGYHLTPEGRTLLLAAREAAH